MPIRAGRAAAAERIDVGPEAGEMQQHGARRDHRQHDQGNGREPASPGQPQRESDTVE